MRHNSEEDTAPTLNIMHFYLKGNFNFHLTGATSCTVVKLADAEGILEMGQNVLHLVHAWRVLGAFTCVKLLWGHQKHLVHFHSMCSFPRKERSFEEQITCPPQPNSLGRLSKYFLEHGLLIRPLWPVLSQLVLGQDLTVWAKSGMGF